MKQELLMGKGSRTGRVGRRTMIDFASLLRRARASRD